MGFVSMLEDIRDAIDSGQREISSVRSRVSASRGWTKDEVFRLLDKMAETLGRAEASYKQCVEVAEFLKRAGIDPDARAAKSNRLSRQAALTLAPELRREHSKMRTRLKELESVSETTLKELAQEKSLNGRLKAEIRGLKSRLKGKRAAKKEPVRKRVEIVISKNDKKDLINANQDLKNQQRRLGSSSPKKRRTA